MEMVTRNHRTACRPMAAISGLHFVTLFIRCLNRLAARPDVIDILCKAGRCPLPWRRGLVEGHAAASVSVHGRWRRRRVPADDDRIEIRTRDETRTVSR